MKKLLLTCMLFAIATMGFAQTTYYWVGGASATTLNGSDWSTTPAGPAVSRTAPIENDILVFDNQTVAFQTQSQDCGKLVLQNSANVSFTRDPASSGTAILSLNGAAGVGLEINNSILNLSGSISGFNYTVLLPNGITGLVSNGGQVSISGTASNRISVRTAGALVFNSGTSFTTNSSGFTPFDIFTNTSTENAVIFRNGSTINYLGGLSPFGNSTASNIISMEPTSNFIFNVAPASGFFNSRVFGNVTFKTGVTVSLASENFIKMNNLTIETLASFTLRNSGGQAIGGNILNNGTLGVNSTIGSSTLIMSGNTPQSVSGTGTFNALGLISVANDANVTINRNLTFNGTNTGNVIGRLNFGTSTISGTARMQFRSASSTTDIATTVAGSNTITVGAGGSNNANYQAISPSIGLLVTGPGIPANSYIINTASGSSSFTISNFATASGTGVSITLTGGNPTFSTSNTGGPDASLTTTGSNNANPQKSIGSGTNLIIEAATSTPIPTTFFNAGNVAQTNISFGNLTINAAATTNANATVTGALTFGAAKLTIRTGDELTMSSTSSFAGMGTNAYVVTAANTSTGAVGLVKLAGVSSSKMVPVGSPTNYLPVTVNPVASSDFSVNAFEGLTANATPNGTALTAAQKLEAVNAVWNVNRTSGTGNCTVSLGWTDALEGANFTGTEPALGVSQYTTSYSAFSGTASSSSNTASVTTTNDALGSFIVGKNTTLPVTVTTFTAKAVNQTAALAWVSNSEVNLDKYNLQRSLDGVNFETIGTVKANNKAGVFTYSFVDKAPAFGANYYQLVSVDIDGTLQNKGIASVNFGSLLSISVYPNPTTNSVNVNGLVKGDLVTVNDLSGRAIQSKLVDTDNQLSIDLTNSNTGVYFINVSRGGKITSSNKIVKN